MDKQDLEKKVISKTTEDIEQDKEAARLKLVNILYDTPDARLSELTVIPRNMTMLFALGEMLDKAADMLIQRSKKHHKGGNFQRFFSKEDRKAIREKAAKKAMNGGSDGLVLLTNELRQSYFKMQRSIGAAHLMRGTMLAQAQMVEEEEEDMEKGFGL